MTAEGIAIAGALAASLLLSLLLLRRRSAEHEASGATIRRRQGVRAPESAASATAAPADDEIHRINLEVASAVGLRAVRRSPCRARKVYTDRNGQRRYACSCGCMTDDAEQLAVHVGNSIIYGVKAPVDHRRMMVAGLAMALACCVAAGLISVAMETSLAG